MKKDELQRLAVETARRYNLRPELFLALIQRESGWNVRAKSGAGAQGLAQLMPGTADALGVRDPFDAAENLDAGARYLLEQLDRFGGREDLALAAYNAGPRNVQKHGGIPPFRETQEYVPAILRDAEQWRQRSDSFNAGVGMPTLPPQTVALPPQMPPDGMVVPVGAQPAGAGVAPIQARPIQLDAGIRPPDTAPGPMENPWLMMGLGILGTPTGQGSPLMGAAQGIQQGLGLVEQARQKRLAQDQDAYRNMLYQQQLLLQLQGQMGGGALSPSDQLQATGAPKTYLKADGTPVVAWFDRATRMFYDQAGQPVTDIRQEAQPVPAGQGRGAGAPQLYVTTGPDGQPVTQNLAGMAPGATVPGIVQKLPQYGSAATGGGKPEWKDLVLPSGERSPVNIADPGFVAPPGARLENLASNTAGKGPGKLYSVTGPDGTVTLDEASVGPFLNRPGYRVLPLASLNPAMVTPPSGPPQAMDLNTQLPPAGSQVERIGQARPPAYWNVVFKDGTKATVDVNSQPPDLAQVASMVPANQTPARPLAPNMKRVVFNDGRTAFMPESEIPREGVKDVSNLPTHKPQADGEVDTALVDEAVNTIGATLDKITSGGTPEEVEKRKRVLGTLGSAGRTASGFAGVIDAMSGSDLASRVKEFYGGIDPKEIPSKLAPVVQQIARLMVDAKGPLAVQEQQRAQELLGLFSSGITSPEQALYALQETYAMAKRYQAALKRRAAGAGGAPAAVAPVTPPSAAAPVMPPQAGPVRGQILPGTNYEMWRD